MAILHLIDYRESEREKFIPPGGTRPKGLILRYLIAN